MSVCCCYSYPCSCTYSWNPYPWVYRPYHPGQYLCWCGQYHAYGYPHYQPWPWPNQITIVPAPKPEKKPKRRPGSLKKEDVDKANDVLKGK